MAELLILYAVFCITTSLTTYIILAAPVLKRLSEEEPDNFIANQPVLAAFVFIVLATLVAPILFIPAIVPSFGETFKESLFESLKE